MKIVYGFPSKYHAELAPGQTLLSAEKNVRECRELVAAAELHLAALNYLKATERLSPECSLTVTIETRAEGPQS